MISPKRVILGVCALKSSILMSARGRQGENEWQDDEGVAGRAAEDDRPTPRYVQAGDSTSGSPERDHDRREKDVDGDREQERSEVPANPRDLGGDHDGEGEHHQWHHRPSTTSCMIAPHGVRVAAS